MRHDCDDLAWSPVDNQLFVIMNNTGGLDRLAVVDTTDGTTTDFGVDVGIEDIEGMGFGLDGTLFWDDGWLQRGRSYWSNFRRRQASVRRSPPSMTSTGRVTTSRSIARSTQPPIADDDTAATDEDNAVNIDVLDGDVDNDNHALANPTVATAPTFGSAQVQANGTITYTPNPNANGTDTFTYQVCDPFNACDTATVTVTVAPVPDDPIAANDAASTLEDTPTTIDVRANDQEVDGEVLSAPTITAAPSNGTAAVNGAGNVTYTPNAEFSGTDTFTYEVCDPGNACDTATVTVTVVEVNDPPIAQDDAAATDVDQRVNIDVRANDSDPEGGQLENPTIVDGPANGQAQVQANGEIGYGANAGFSGTDSFTYQVCDAGNACSTATVTVTVAPPNAPPDAVDDAVSLDEDASANFDPRANDSDPDGDPLAAPTIDTAPSNGQAVVAANGTITYTPDADFFGIDTLIYEVCDDQNNCATATATFTVAGIDDDPNAGDDDITVAQGQTTVVDVRGNDVDVDGDVLESPTIDTPPALGTATVLGDGTVQYVAGDTPGSDTFTYEVCDGTGRCDTAAVTVTIVDDQTPVPVGDTADVDEDDSIVIDVLANDVDPNGDPLTPSIATSPANGAAVVLGDGTVRYTPNPDFSGEDSFTYQVCDDEDNCATATVTVTVAPINDAPVAVDDVASTDEDAPIEVSVTDNDSDPDGDTLTPSVATAPANGAAEVLPGGTVRYTPNTGFIGEDTFTIEVCDPSGACDQSTLTVSVGLDGAPLAGDDIATAQEDGETTINVLANDQDPEGDPLTVTAEDPPNGEVFVQPDGSVVYRPDPDFFGTDTFSYQVCDPTPRCDTATVTVSVTPVDDAPRVADDGATTDADLPVFVAVLDNDVEVDGEGLAVSVATAPSDGIAVAQPNGEVLYTPDAGFTGDDTFAYEACDDRRPVRDSDRDRARGRRQRGPGRAR